MIYCMLSINNFRFLSVLDLSVDNDLYLAERQMQAMAKVLHKLICDGNSYKNSIFSKFLIKIFDFRYPIT